jgi:hypothetical protein
MPIVKVRLKPNERIVEKKTYAKLVAEDAALKNKVVVLEQAIAKAKATTVSEWGVIDIDKVVAEATAVFMESFSLKVITSLVQTQFNLVIAGIVKSITPTEEQLTFLAESIIDENKAIEAENAKMKSQISDLTKKLESYTSTK